MRTRRRSPVIASALGVFVLAVTGTVLLFTTHGGAGAARRTPSDVLGPGPVTVTLDIDHSKFEPTLVRVRPHTEVRFVVVNRDPIGHELIVGDAEVHTRHEGGHEAEHPPRRGEVSVKPGERASTKYFFHEPGEVLYACHLPGHFEYGMKGTVVVTPA